MNIPPVNNNIATIVEIIIIKINVEKPPDGRRVAKI
jgi:hypothetical protein